MTEWVTACEKSTNLDWINKSKMNRERDDNIYYARLAEQGERYEDMIRYMKEVAKVSYFPSSSSSFQTEQSVSDNRIQVTAQKTGKFRRIWNQTQTLHVC